MYENTINIFHPKQKVCEKKIGDLGVDWRLTSNYWNHKKEPQKPWGLS
jgi:hypothetical protein